MSGIMPGRTQHDLPSISIVTCSYQQGRYLDATMRSVLEQGYQALEYIVVDGASTDNSRAVIESHAASLGYWVSEPDGGQTEALIKGFAHSTGDIQGWLCSDDLLLPGALATIAEFFAEHPEIEAVYGDSLWINANGHYLRTKKEMGFNRFAFLFDHNYISQPSMFWRRTLYEKVGGLNPQFNLAMDADLWERFSRETRITHIPAYLSCMRYYPEQKTRAMRAKGQVEDQQIRMRSRLASSSLAYPGFMPALRRLAHVQRILQKLLAGGYHATPPVDAIASLERYYIVGEAA